MKIEDDVDQHIFFVIFNVATMYYFIMAGSQAGHKGLSDFCPPDISPKMVFPIGLFKTFIFPAPCSGLNGLFDHIRFVVLFYSIFFSEPLKLAKL